LFRAVPLRNVQPRIELGDGVERLGRILATPNRVFKLGDDDPLAVRIHDDFMALCHLEKSVPRLQWLDLLMSFLRLALPVWMLAWMRIVVYLQEWLVAALDEGIVPEESEILGKITARHAGLFHPTTTPTREIQHHVERYMKARVEASIALTELQPLLKEVGLDISNDGRRRLVPRGESSGDLKLQALLDRTVEIRGRFRQHVGLTARQVLTREGEKYRGWRTPRKGGSQGKNYDEFLRVMRRYEEGDEGQGYLLDYKRGEGHVVFPGPLLIKTVACLADRTKGKRYGPKKKGPLLLGDLETHFREYGIDFSVAAGGRPRLIKELSEMGLLRGSPDAGESAQVAVPYGRWKE
jgi:hypothetical protein